MSDLSQWSESMHPRDADGKFGAGGHAPKVIPGAEVGKGYGGVRASLIKEVHEFDGRTGLQAVIHRTDGVKVYKYTDQHIQQQSDAKFARAVVVDKALPSLRSSVAADLGSKDKATRDLATVTSLIDKHCIRVGGSAAEERTGSRGASTLEAQHVTVNKNGSVALKFDGKSGVGWDVHVTGATARNVAAAAEGKKPGDRLFSVSPQRVNEYVKAKSGVEMSAKDFRTHHASGLVHEALEKLPRPKNDKEIKANVKSAIESAAKVLGHTPSVCRSSYVNPRVLDEYEARHKGAT